MAKLPTVPGLYLQGFHIGCEPKWLFNWPMLSGYLCLSWSNAIGGIPLHDFARNVSGRQEIFQHVCLASQKQEPDHESPGPGRMSPDSTETRFSHFVFKPEDRAHPIPCQPSCHPIKNVIAGSREGT